MSRRWRRMGRRDERRGSSRAVRTHRRGVASAPAWIDLGLQHRSRHPALPRPPALRADRRGRQPAWPSGPGVLLADGCVAGDPVMWYERWGWTVWALVVPLVAYPICSPTTAADRQWFAWCMV